MVTKKIIKFYLCHLKSVNEYLLIHYKEMLDS